MKKTLLVLLTIIGICFLGYFLYSRYFINGGFYKPESSNIYQINRDAISNDFILNKLEKNDVYEINSSYVRLKGGYQIEQKLDFDKIPYVLISNSFPLKNNNGAYIVKINDNFVDAKLQEISKYVTIIQKKYSWESSTYIDSTFVVWGKSSDIEKIRKLSEVESVMQYELIDRLDPELVKSFNENDSINTIRVQIYDIYKSNGKIEDDSFFKILESSRLSPNKESKTISLDANRLGKEYTINGKFTDILGLLRNNPEVIRVFE